MPSDFKERRLYRFKCAQCGRMNAQSFKRRLARALKCRKCRYAKKVDERQMSLVPEASSDKAGISNYGEGSFAFKMKDPNTSFIGHLDPL